MKFFDILSLFQVDYIDNIGIKKKKIFNLKKLYLSSSAG